MEASGASGKAVEMAQCRCRDTGTKRCRWEFSTPDPFRSATPSPGKAARLAQRDPRKGDRRVRGANA